MPKKATDKPAELNEKTFLTLLAKRKRIQKRNAKEKKKLERAILRLSYTHEARLQKVNEQLKTYAGWLNKLADS